MQIFNEVNAESQQPNPGVYDGAVCKYCRTPYARVSEITVQKETNSDAATSLPGYCYANAGQSGEGDMGGPAPKCPGSAVKFGRIGPPRHSPVTIDHFACHQTETRAEKKRGSIDITNLNNPKATMVLPHRRLTRLRRR